MEIDERRLADLFSEHWWMLSVRGLVAVAFGALTFLQPGISISAMVLLFGAFAWVDGIITIWPAVAGCREDKERWVLHLGGMIGIGIGALTFIVPDLTAVALLFCIATWAIGTGVLQIVVAIRLPKEIDGDWMIILAGLISITFGVLLMLRLAAGALVLSWLIGFYATVFGILLLILAFKARKFKRKVARQ